MELKLKYLLTLGISLFLNLVGYVIAVFIIFFIMSFSGGFKSIMVSSAKDPIEFFVFLIISFIPIFGILVMILGGYIFYQLKFKNKFNNNLNLIYSIINMLNLPIGLILGIFMLLFGNDISKNMKKIKK